MAGFDFSPFLEPVANTSAPAAVQAAPVAPVAVVKPEIKVVKKSVEETSTFDFSDYFEAVTDVLTAQPQTAAPVSENAERQFYQSGVGMEDRVFEPEAEGFVEPVLPEAIVTPQSNDQFVERNVSPDEQNFISMAESPRYSSELVTQTIGQGYADFTDTREATRSAQAGLTQLGYVPRGIDGRSGGGTEAALRSFQEAEGLPVTGTLDATTYQRIQDPKTKKFQSTNVVEESFSEFANVEDTEAHLGAADFTRVGITLPYGIVPDRGLQYNHNGTIINLPSLTANRWSTLSAAGVTRDNFDPDNVITDNASKEGVKRGEYQTDKEWTKATITAFEQKMDASIRDEGVDPDDLTDEALQGILSYGWNRGSGVFNNALTRAVYQELDNTPPDIDVIKDSMLTVFTVGGHATRGLGNRRAMDLNFILDSLNDPTITHYKPLQLANGNAGFEYTYSDGTTETVDADTSYANADYDNFKVHLNVLMPVG